MKPNVFVPLSFLFLLSTTQAATVTKTTITKTSVTPTLAAAGTMFKFTAILNAPLIIGNKVKIDLGKGSEVMTGAKTSYSLSRAIYTTGKQTYNVGIYDAQNVLQGVVKNGNYSVKSSTLINHAPTLTLTSADATATTNKNYTVTLNAKDVDANLNAITMNWGDSTAPETLTATDSKDLVFSHTYATASSFGWNTFATDKGSPALTSKLVSKIVTVSKPVEVVVKPVVLPKTTGYSKIANDGSLLPDDAKLGSKRTDWACTQDNKTGLIWEVKTASGGLRDWRYSYSWYKPEGDNGGNAGYQNNGIRDYCTFPSDEFSGGSECNTYAFTNAVNAQGLCGAKDWRLPNNEELKGLVYCSDDKYNTLAEGSYGYICKGNEAIPVINTTTPTINSFYFPNTQDWIQGFYWSSSPNADYSNGAWGVNFGFGSSRYSDKGNYNVVRLVRFLKSTSVSNPAPVEVIEPPVKTVEVIEPPVKTTSYSKIANDGSLLPNDAKLGTNPTNWACTKDNQTGLIWEVKTTDGGLRDSAKTYTWDNSFNFAADVNAQGLCGAKDWRLPTIQELGGLLVCSDGKYTTNGNEYDNANGAIDCTNILTISRPTINTTYFPDIKDNYWFWSSSPASGSDSYAWGIAAYYGNSGNDVKSYGNNVRLVR